MKSSIIALTLIGAAVARPAAIMKKREVPQEHSHENIVSAVNTALKLNNPDNISDAVFGLLGNAAGIKGAGKIADADCLQQATADQAFTNAKAAGDVVGMTNALIYRALERNTGSVGLASVACSSIKAVNPEIAALQQHQDPASDGAADLNKKIATELAKQIASVGGDATQANEASTFAPGQKGDSTGAGNTCDDANDAAGCINTQKLRIDDLSADEISAAVAGVSAGSAAASNSTANAGSNAGSNSASNVQACAAVGSNSTAAAGDAADSQKQNGDKKKGKKNGDKKKDGKKNGDKKQKGNKNKDNKGQDQNAAAGNATVSAGNDNAAAAAGNNAAASAGNNNAADAGNAASGAAAASGLGNCNAKINFGIPSDGRKEDAFEAADLATFPHGSALNIAVISNFICSQITSKCDVSAAEASKCDAAATAANGLKGQAAADAFNSALGQ